MAKKLSATNIAILSAETLLLGMSVSISAAYILKWETLYTMAVVNTAANIPLLLAASDALRQELGLKSPITIAGNRLKIPLGRKIPISAGDKKTNIFMQTLTPLIINEVTQLESISIWWDNNSHTLVMAELEEFLRVAWCRQRQKQHPFSRQYWILRRKPRLTTLEYNIRMIALTGIPGLVIDRGPGRSGRLMLPPQEAMKMIRNRY